MVDTTGMDLFSAIIINGLVGALLLAIIAFPIYIVAMIGLIGRGIWRAYRDY